MNVSKSFASFFITALAAFGSTPLQASSNLLSANVSEVDPALSNQSSLAACNDARPDAYLALCNRFSTEQGLLRCIATGRGAYFAECALTLCQRFTTEEGAIRCLDAASNKTYSSDEIALCNRFTTENGAIDCLRSSGAPYGGSDDSLLRQVRSDIALALDDIYAGRTRQAALILEDVLNQIDSSFERAEKK